jgi:hypothetical protein
MLKAAINDPTAKAAGINPLLAVPEQGSPLPLVIT